MDVVHVGLELSGNPVDQGPGAHPAPEPVQPVAAVLLEAERRRAHVGLGSLVHLAAADERKCLAVYFHITFWLYRVLESINDNGSLPL